MYYNEIQMILDVRKKKSPADRADSRRMYIQALRLNIHEEISSRFLPSLDISFRILRIHFRDLGFFFKRQYPLDTKKRIFYIFVDFCLAEKEFYYKEGLFLNPRGIICL